MELRFMLSTATLVAVLFSAGCGRGKSSQSFDPAKIKSIIFYDTDPRGAKDYSILTNNVSSYVLKPQERDALFAQTSRKSRAVWKGAFLAVVRLQDDKEFHVAVSYFDGFGRVLETGEGISFDGASRAEYERVKSAAFRVFLPERRQLNSEGHHD